MILNLRKKPADLGLETTPMEILWREAELAARNLPPFAAEAERFALSVNRGVHGRRKSGSGDSFWQFRPYQPGDGSSDIDWRRSGRTDQLFVRQNEWETAQNVWFWCDTSKSMHFRSETDIPEKIDRAIVLALAAAIQLTAGGERVAHLGSQGRAAAGRFGVRRLMDSLTLRRFEDTPAFPASAPPSRHSHLVLIGDFLSDEETIVKSLAPFVANGVEGHLVQVLDPAEEDFPFKGRVRLEGVEDKSDLLIGRAEDARSTYRTRMKAWQETLGRITREAGWTFTTHRTDRQPHTALLALMATMAERGDRKGHAC